MDTFRFLHVAPEDVLVPDPEIRRLPASCQAVFEAIRLHGPMSHGDLQAATDVPPRTIRFALRRLKDRGLVDSRPSLRDSRICYFFIPAERVDPAARQQRRLEAEAGPGVLLRAGRLHG